LYDFQWDLAAGINQRLEFVKYAVTAELDRTYLQDGIAFGVQTGGF
jgi:hypothetical protein